MAQVKVFYEPETELLTVFWQQPRKEQICTELGDGVILIKDSTSGEPISSDRNPIPLHLPTTSQVLNPSERIDDV